ncbi:MAG: S46 family peptidase [Bacteroidota bacterium]|nr:S46 family peptidase [Bacteroidota bacterium]
MKKYLILLVSLFVILSSSIAKPINPPDEGMWLPFLLTNNYEEMKALGLKLTPEDIYNVNKSSLKDAIIIFGGGCTGEMVSPDGLILTNHHCGFGQIQSHSTVEHDYLKNGFWAKSRDQELPNEGLSVKFLISIEDVTDDVLDGIDEGTTEYDRDSIIRKNSKEIEGEANADNHYLTEVKSFFAGNNYYLFLYEEFTDVRLVGAPPTSIGKFGADTDNWMWPRHTGDFSMFRVYCAPDGNPADYSEENVPYHPKHFLPISLKPKKKGDFSMIMGNPGTTERYLTSYGINLALKHKNPSIVDIRTVKLELMKEDMDACEKVRIMYATKYAHTANYWKYFQGQSRGLKRLHVYDKKLALEKDFQKWFSKSDKNIQKYGNVMSDYQEAYKVLSKYEVPSNYFFEAIYRGAEFITLANSYRGLYKLLTADEVAEGRLERYVNYYKSNLDKHFKDYNFETDKKIFGAMMKMYFENVDKEFHPEIYSYIMKKFDGNFDEYAEYVFDKSIFVSKERILEFLENPKAKTIKKDPGFNVMKQFVDVYISILDKSKVAKVQKAKADRLFIDGLMKMKKDKKFYPDANFTMRVTYGTVQDYYPSDAVHYNYYTTMKGIIEKEDPTDDEFIVSPKLKELYDNKDFGEYGVTDEAGNKVMKVCFLTDHDITGGNSGSPVLDGEGNLTGIAFDGNWEAMSGDIAFEPELQRTINVDIRYVLFVIDKFAGAKNLIDEMKIIRPEKKKEEKKELEEVVE